MSHCLVIGQASHLHTLTLCIPGDLVTQLFATSFQLHLVVLKRPDHITEHAPHFLDEIHGICLLILLPLYEELQVVADCGPGSLAPLYRFNSMLRILARCDLPGLVLLRVGEFLFVGVLDSPLGQDSLCATIR